MANEISTVQSLKAVDAWIDVINANINGGVRTAFKSSRLKFSGSNVNVVRTGNLTSLPLQMPEPGLTTANTVIDFSQGAITASTENTHLAVQGDGFFMIASPDLIETNPALATFGTTKAGITGAKLLLTRDGEFRTNQFGLVQHVATGYYLMTTHWDGASGKLQIYSSSGGPNGLATGTRAVYNNLDNPTMPAVGGFVPLTEFIENANAFTAGGGILDRAGNNLNFTTSLVRVGLGAQNLHYSSFGSTVFDFGYQATASTAALGQFDAAISLDPWLAGNATILSKSLEASNASMTQSVPELSLAQKLFSALTKVLQISQTNTDAVLNLIR